MLSSEVSVSKQKHIEGEEPNQVRMDALKALIRRNYKGAIIINDILKHKISLIYWKEQVNLSTEKGSSHIHIKTYQTNSQQFEKLYFPPTGEYATVQEKHGQYYPFKESDKIEFRPTNEKNYVQNTYKLKNPKTDEIEHQVIITLGHKEGLVRSCYSSEVVVDETKT